MSIELTQGKLLRIDDVMVMFLVSLERITQILLNERKLLIILWDIVLSNS